MINLDILGPFTIDKPALTLRPKALPRTASSTPGPVGWWKLDEPQGATAANAAGTNLLGQLRGQPQWLTRQGHLGGALELDGLDDWLECPHGPELEFQEQLSISVWIKSHPAQSQRATLVAKGNAWQLARLPDTNLLTFSLTGPQTTGPKPNRPTTVTTRKPVPTDEWHHIAATYDGKRIALYFDGIEQETLAASGPIALNNLPLTLGENLVSRSRPWRGALDDARIYNRALSPSEIKTLADTPVSQALR